MHRKVAECNDASRAGCPKGCATRRGPYAPPPARTQAASPAVHRRAARAPRSYLIVRSRCGRARCPHRAAAPGAVRGLASRPTAALRLWGAIDGALPARSSPCAIAAPHRPWRLATAPPPDRAYDFLRNSGTISITFAHSASGSAEISAILFSSCRQSGSYSYSS